MADNPISSPFPDIDLAFVDGQGRVNRVWYEFLLRQFKRSGGSQGVDTSVLKTQIAQILQHLEVVDGEITDLGLLVESNPYGATILAVLGRLAVVEMLVASQIEPTPMRRAPDALPDVVAPVSRVSQVLPEAVAVSARPANDDLRKLIEAQI